MRNWEDLTLMQKLIIGAGILMLGMFAPEIALLVHFGGIEVAFAFLLFYFNPILNWLAARVEDVNEILTTAFVSYASSASARPKIYATQAVFCCLAFALTGSLAMSVGFLMPGMLFNPLLV